MGKTSEHVGGHAAATVRGKAFAFDQHVAACEQCFEIGAGFDTVRLEDGAGNALRARGEFNLEGFKKRDDFTGDGAEAVQADAFTAQRAGAQDRHELGTVTARHGGRRPGGGVAQQGQHHQQGMFGDGVIDERAPIRHADTA